MAGGGYPAWRHWRPAPAARLPHPPLPPRLSAPPPLPAPAGRGGGAGHPPRPAARPRGARLAAPALPPLAHGLASAGAGVAAVRPAFGRRCGRVPASSLGCGSRRAPPALRAVAPAVRVLARASRPRAARPRCSPPFGAFGAPRGGRGRRGVGSRAFRPRPPVGVPPRRPLRRASVSVSSAR